MNLKKFLAVLAAAFSIFSAAALSFSITAAKSGGISVVSIKQVNSVSKRRNKISPANDSNVPFVAAELTRSVDTGASEYDYVLWTEKPLSAAERSELVSFIAANTSGGLKSINAANTRFVSGDPYTWTDAPGSKNTLSFTHDYFSLSLTSVIRRFAYGEISLSGQVTQPSATAATTAPTTVTQTQAVSTTTTTITTTAVTTATTVTTTSVTSTSQAATSETRPTIVIESLTTRPTQLEPPPTTTGAAPAPPPSAATTTSQAAATTTQPEATTSAPVSDLNPTIIISTAPVPTQQAKPDPPQTTANQQPATTEKSTFPGSGGK